MVFSDIPLLAKKIVVAILVAFIPLLILLGGVWFTQKALKVDKPAKESFVTPKQ